MDLKSEVSGTFGGVSDSKTGLNGEWPEESLKASCVLNSEPAVIWFLKALR